MKDAKGHGSDAHSAGVQQIGRTPAGNPMHDLANEATPEPILNAYFGGSNAYITGRPESANPHTEPHLQQEWSRGYRVKRKEDRFHATIMARKQK